MFIVIGVSLILLCVACLILFSYCMELTKKVQKIEKEKISKDYIIRCEECLEDGRYFKYIITDLKILDVKRINEQGRN